MTSVRLTSLSLVRSRQFTLGPIDLELASGSSTALIGPSGSGKSTLLRCIAGLEQGHSGTLEFDGARVGRGTRSIGFMFQSGALWPHMNALQHLAFAAPKRPRQELEALLDSVGLGDKMARLPSQLSGGEGQRLALARALAAAPQLLLLDEPLHSLDVHLRDELAYLVRRLTRELKLTLLLVTHDRDEALAMADDLVVMHAGRIIERGSTTQLLTDPRTGYAAAFVGRATCLPVTANGDGRVHTAIGALPRPADMNGELQLVLMPGDLRQASAPCALSATVLRVEAWPSGAIAVVDLDGRSVRVPCSHLPHPGDRIAIELTRPARLLPSGVKIP